MIGGSAEHSISEPIRAELDARAGASGTVERRQSGQALEYLAAGQVVAAVEPGSVSFRLGREIATAAARTEGAAASSRGPDWVRLSPSALDLFALDRAVAWFDLAVRSADSSSR